MSSSPFLPRTISLVDRHSGIHQGTRRCRCSRSTGITAACNVQIERSRCTETSADAEHFYLITYKHSAVDVPHGSLVEGSAGVLRQVDNRLPAVQPLVQERRDRAPVHGIVGLAFRSASSRSRWPSWPCSRSVRRFAGDGWRF